MADERYPNLPSSFKTFRTLSQYDPSYFPKIMDVNPDWGTLEEKLGTMRYIVDYDWHSAVLDIDRLFVDSLDFEMENISLPDNPTEDDIKSAGFMYLFSCKHCDYFKKFYRSNDKTHLLDIGDEGILYFSFTPQNPPIVDKSFPFYISTTLLPKTPTADEQDIKNYVDEYIKKNISKFTPASYDTVETEFNNEKPDELFSVIDGPAPRCLDGMQFTVKTYYIADYSYYMKEEIADYSKDKLNPTITYNHTFKVKKK